MKIWHLQIGYCGIPRDYFYTQERPPSSERIRKLWEEDYGWNPNTPEEQWHIDHKDRIWKDVHEHLTNGKIYHNGEGYGDEQWVTLKLVDVL